MQRGQPIMSSQDLDEIVLRIIYFSLLSNLLINNSSSQASRVLALHCRHRHFRLDSHFLSEYIVPRFILQCRVNLFLLVHHCSSDHSEAQLVMTVILARWQRLSCVLRGECHLLRLQHILLWRTTNPHQVDVHEGKPELEVKVKKTILEPDGKALQNKAQSGDCRVVFPQEEIAHWL